MAGNDQQNAEALGSKELELQQLEPACPHVGEIARRFLPAARGRAASS
jgi:hypothetical protein